MAAPGAPRGRRLVVTTAFETTRLAGEALGGVYRALVPQPARRVGGVEAGVQQEARAGAVRSERCKQGR